MKTTRYLQSFLIVLGIVFAQIASGRETKTPSVSTASIAAFLTGRYDNSQQMTQGKSKSATDEDAMPHVTVTIEPTQKPDWALWRIHMDVDADHSLDATWAMNIARRSFDGSLSIIPYTSRPSFDANASNASSFDEAQWLSLEACMLRGDFSPTKTSAHSEGEPCAAEGMGLGGKRAFLPASVDREGDHLRVQLIFRGNPLRVDALRVK